MPSNNKNECDAVSVLMGLAIFALPITLLVPGFSISDVIPKIHIERLHIFDQYLSWPQLNAAMITLLVIFFCFYLEIRKRHLDEIVENVLTVTQATDAVIEEERDRQAETMRACMKLLDSSVEHYENLILLRDDLRLRKKPQHPPVIELSSSELKIYDQ